jgi:ketosteroid isomerase-like protein
MATNTTTIQAPVAVLERLTAAINAVDADEIRELFATTATIANPDGLVLTGEEGVRQFIQNVANFHITMRLGQTEVQGEQVNGIVEIANDYHRQVGVAPLEIDLQATVRDGKVTSLGGPFTPGADDKLGPLRASDRFYAALSELSRGNPGPMADVWSQGADVSAMHPVGGRELGWEQVWQSFDQAARQVLESPMTVERSWVSDLKLVRLREDLAYTLCTEHVDCTIGGQPISLQGRATNIFRREGDTWKIIHHHADPFPALYEALAASAHQG